MNKDLKNYLSMEINEKGCHGWMVYDRDSGKQFFIKEYGNFPLPFCDGVFDAETVSRREKLFDSFVGARRKVADALKSNPGHANFMLVPCETFVHDNRYCEVIELIDGGVYGDAAYSIINSLAEGERLRVLKTLAAALVNVHSTGVIHGDINCKSVALVNNPPSDMFAVLTHFDHSFFADDKTFLGGDEAYRSPELAAYLDCEDDALCEELLKCITEKTDIFSLGALFHYYLSGERIFAGGNGCELTLSDKIKSPYLRDLLTDMLNKDPEKRPTAAQVLGRL